IFWEHLGNRGVRMGDWKLVSKDKGQWELYNLRTDRTERINVFDENQNVSKKMLKAYRQWAEKVGVRGGP
ncbi:MAG TPA: arylsulfatase, partial [Pricia sp.]|nr:arylsulfatase [Pricia sp.]